MVMTDILKFSLNKTPEGRYFTWCRNQVTHNLSTCRVQQVDCFMNNKNQKVPCPVILFVISPPLIILSVMLGLLLSLSIYKSDMIWRQTVPCDFKAALLLDLSSY